MNNREKKKSDLVPDHNAETAFAERLLVPLEESGVVKRPLAALRNKSIDKNPLKGEGGHGPYRANKTLPAPLAAKSLDRPHPVPNALLASLTLWHPQPYVAVLAIWVALIHRESHIRILKHPVSREAPVT